MNILGGLFELKPKDDWKSSSPALNTIKSDLVSVLAKFFVLINTKRVQNASGDMKSQNIVNKQTFLSVCEYMSDRIR